MSNQRSVVSIQYSGGIIMRRSFVGLIVGLLIPSLLGYSIFEIMSDQANAKQFQVGGSAMEPNFHDGQIVEVEEVPVTDLQRGDVIVFSPDKERQYLKRLIGLPGETVEIRDGKVYINGKVLDEPYIKQTASRDSQLFIVEPDRYFVLGDNRNNSSDSRSFGSILGESILGRVKQ
jgi:signal peptidase I